MKIFACAIVAIAALAGSANAGDGSASNTAQFTRIDWQSPEQLPPQFRNHCTADFWHGHYCSDHCGTGYQFYYCSSASFGCCHLGVGYCDWNGSLRCGPGLLPY
jgi:hypothetical protein